MVVKVIPPIYSAHINLNHKKRNYCILGLFLNLPMYKRPDQIIYVRPSEVMGEAARDDVRANFMRNVVKIMES